MSYDNEKKAFDRTAKRLQEASRKSGKDMSFRDAQNNLRTHLNKSKYKK